MSRSFRVRFEARLGSAAGRFVVGALLFFFGGCALEDASISPRRRAVPRSRARARCGDSASGNLKVTNEKEVPDWPGGGWVGAGPASEEPVIRYRGFYPGRLLLDPGGAPKTVSDNIPNIPGS